MKTCQVWIPVGRDERVSGIVTIPDAFEASKTVGIILAHGAGNDMNSPLIVAAAAVGSAGVVAGAKML